MEEVAVEEKPNLKPLLSKTCFNLLVFITMLPLLAIATVVWVGFGEYYNPLVIPSISEIIEHNVYLKLLYVSVIIIVQFSLILMYSQIENRVFNEKNSTIIFTIKILSILQCLGFVLIAIFDVSIHPYAHYAVTGSTFFLTIIRQAFFYMLDFDIPKVQKEEFNISLDSSGHGFCLCFKIKGCNKEARLEALIILNVFQVIAILALLISYTVVILNAEVPHTSIALCEHAGIMLTSLLHFYNVKFVYLSRKIR